MSFETFNNRVKQLQIAAVSATFVVFFLFLGLIGGFGTAAGVYGFFIILGALIGGVVSIFQFCEAVVEYKGAAKRRDEGNGNRGYYGEFKSLADVQKKWPRFFPLLQKLESDNVAK